jgi:hypothetical protein
MKDLMNDALCHPLVALPMFYLTDLMFAVDYSVASAALVLASTSLVRLLRLLKNVPKEKRVAKFMHSLVRHSITPSNR